MSIRVRPRFRIHSERSSSEIEEHFRNKLKEEDHSYEGRVIEGHVVIKVIPEEQHYWSPQLSLSMEEETDGKTLIRGLYGPNPGVWLMFTIVHIATSVAAMFVLIIGLSNMSLGLSSMILWSLPVLAVISLIMYLIARAGRKMGEEQLFDLHHFFEQHFGEKVVIE